MQKSFTMPILWSHFTGSRLLPLLENCQKYYTLSRSMCSPRLNTDSYRSDALAEAANRVFPQSCHTPFSTDMAQACSDFMLLRESLAQEGEIPTELRINTGAPLSLLLVNWQQSLFDGACSPETYNYIDDDCMPGWDTWLGIISLSPKQDEYALLCWVPPEMCRNVDSAIAIDAADCMSWLAFDVESNRPTLLGWGKRWPK